MSQEEVALEAAALGMRYGRRREPVLADLSVRLPAGRVCALVGPNGAGKSTVLRLAAGLLRPTEGALRVLGTSPVQARPRVAYVAQQKPLRGHLTVAETLRYGAELNPGWDADVAERFAYADGLDPDAKVRRLSGGQRTRIALALAVGKRAELMLLDEPMADLDPLARHELAGALLAVAAEHGTTVVMASHVIAELEDSCDHLMLLGGGRVRLAGRLDDLRADHVLLTGRTEGGPGADGDAGDVARHLAPHTVVEARQSGRGTTALVRRRGDVRGAWTQAAPTLEEVVLAYLRNPAVEPPLTDVAANASREVAV